VRLSNSLKKLDISYKKTSTTPNFDLLAL